MPSADYREIVLHRPAALPRVVTLVDAADWPALARHRWYLHSAGYVHRPPGVYLHRELLGQQRGDGGHVDHINGDRLDNRRENLRLVTYQRNQINRHRLNRNNSSGHRGVYWNVEIGKWVAQITSNGKTVSLGCFADLADAVEARRKAELAAFGEICPEAFSASP